MAEHHAFRLTGGAGGVHQRGHLASRVRCDRFRLRRFVQRTDTNLREWTNLAQFGLQPDDMTGRLLGDFSSDENPPRTAMSMNLIQFAWGEARVYDHRPRIELAAGEYERGERHGILACQQHAISWPDLKAPKLGGDGINRPRELTIAPGAIAFDKGRMARLLGDMGCDDFAYSIRQPCKNVRCGHDIDCRRQSVLPHWTSLVAIFRPALGAVPLLPTRRPGQWLPPRRAIDLCRRTFPCRRKRSASRTLRDRRHPG